MKPDYNAILATGYGVDPMVTAAFVLASKAHAGQTRRGTLAPYISHPIRVANMAHALGMSEDAQAAALCHDVIEDCATEWYPKLVAELTPTAFELVRRLSKWWDSSEPPSVVKAHKEHYYEIIRQSPEALVLKILDRTDNLRELRTIAARPELTAWAWNYYEKTAAEFEALVTAATTDGSAPATCAAILFFDAHEAVGVAVEAAMSPAEAEST